MIKGKKIGKIANINQIINTIKYNSIQSKLKKIN